MSWKRSGDVELDLALGREDLRYRAAGLTGCAQHRLRDQRLEVALWLRRPELVGPAQLWPHNRSATGWDAGSREALELFYGNLMLIDSSPAPSLLLLLEAPTIGCFEGHLLLQPSSVPPKAMAVKSRIIRSPVMRG